MKKFLIGIFVFFIIILTIVWRVNIQQKEAYSITICNNLKMANRLSQSYECITSNSMPNFIPILFPLEITTIDYVRDGMKGYEILHEGDVSCGGPKECFRINYNLTGSRYFLYSVNFVFVNGRLTSLSYSD